VDLIAQGLAEAVRRLISLDPDVIEAASTSLQVSGLAVVLSLVVGMPTGIALALGAFPGRRIVLALVNTGLGLPPVVVGLVVAVLLWRSGPLGSLDLWCTRGAMIMAQFVIALPEVIGLTVVAVQALDPLLRTQVAALGATTAQSFAILAAEARLPLLTAAMAGFGAVISELGASLIAGCNIKGDTRILTTAIVFQADRGEFGTAFALAAILLALIFAVNLTVTWVQQRPRPL
jgi:tungstate transport system permease protein